MWRALAFSERRASNMAKMLTCIKKCSGAMGLHAKFSVNYMWQDTWH